MTRECKREKMKRVRKSGERELSEAQTYFEKKIEKYDKSWLATETNGTEDRDGMISRFGRTIMILSISLVSF